MELREFAKRVLFATSLEEKLAGPDSVMTDLCPGTAIACPERPGRPEGWSFSPKGEVLPVPRSVVLEDERDRAVLLHSFANHELLATELMALVLLRFPDAPADFRMGLFRTLREEQRHTGMYLRRIEECGGGFGDFPVNRYFWDAVAPVESPLDYVSRLSLTFEQANLDYARHYAEVFARSGDDRSAGILRKVYRDEIAHVNYGLSWFRRWREKGMTDWEAYERRLVFPLSPSRAKANGAAAFNREGRLDAGLEPDFIRRLELFERSKGRTPRVFWFCPGAEASAAGGRTSEDPVERRIADSIELLMAFLGRRDDVLLVRAAPPLEHLESLRGAGFVLPELEVLGPDGCLAADSVLRERKIRDLCPWAWCPMSARLLEPLQTGLPAGAPRLAERWNPEIRSLHSKALHQTWLREFLGDHEVPGTDPAEAGRVATSEEEVTGAVREIRRAGHGEVLLKAWFGTAGRGHRSWDGDGALGWVRKMIAGQGGVVVEPWLERVFDFSVQYEMDEGGLRRLAFIRLENTRRGQFRAVEAGPRPTRDLDPGLARFLHETVFPVYDGDFHGFLENRLAAVGYRGPVGVDAFVHRTPDDRLAWKPVAEINPRFTMGRVAHEIRGRVAPGRRVRLELVRERGGGPEAVESCLIDPASGRLGEGMIDLTTASGAGRDGIRARLTVEAPGWAKGRRIHTESLFKKY